MKLILKFINFLKDRWEVESDRQFVTILLVFAITGSSAVACRIYLLKALGVDLSSYETPYKYLIRMGVTITIYQFLLIIIGSIFGQFNFFWRFEKRVLGRFVPKVLMKRF